MILFFSHFEQRVLSLDLPTIVAGSEEKFKVMIRDIEGEVGANHCYILPADGQISGGQ
jgi:hypothetical protein